MEMRTKIILFITLAFSWASLTACQGEKKPLPPLRKSISNYVPFQRLRAYFPTKEWRKASPKEVAMDPHLLDQAVKYAFTMTGDEKNRKGVRTDALLIVKNGLLVFERYARGYTAAKRHLAWSTSKSFVNALFGIAVRYKYLTLDEPAFHFYPLLKEGGRSSITIRHLLQMRSGLYWNEGYEASPLNSSVLAMLYTRGRRDMARFTASQKMQYPAGRVWYYSSGTTNLLVGILKEALRKKAHRQLESFAWKELFDRIGMKDVTWERDGAGNFVGSSYLYARPRDLAKFGFLYLNDGIWEGKRILPQGWVRFTASASPADQKGRYGAHWWINVGRPELGISPPWPDAPNDTIATMGHWGQYIVVIPSLDLVVVRVGDDRDHSFKLNLLLKKIIASLPKTSTQKIK